MIAVYYSSFLGFECIKVITFSKKIHSLNKKFNLLKIFPFLYVQLNYGKLNVSKYIVIICQPPK